jgi:hypothetical protein
MDYWTSGLNVLRKQRIGVQAFEQDEQDNQQPPVATRTT